MAPTVLSPASPVELLHYIVTFQAYPTTILICYPREDFIARLVSDAQENTHEDHSTPEERRSLPLLSATLYQTAVARHIRILFIPTVTHLRAYLSAFDPLDSLTPPPPPPNYPPPSSAKRPPPLLLVYGLLNLHRDSSEWSAQGLSNSAAALLEAARRTGFKPVVVEPKGAGGHDFKAVLQDDVPVLSGSSRRDEGVWTGRTVKAKQVLGRWFRFQMGQWDI
ncbi:uncharacterized protein LY79DRAFT_527246 [Colletotrichum navitas]|uniref:Uncharacterized protein n=1 Tax=Colletotrichum navitas TaxID=681940 RepID=A0AAD8UXB9_9PEZI|nr:uncharacterized protein LY79DRAFT_527246 [Colletotrichum navitas]KAK1570255.1 hypothetical protein LY79DRAFT_527246 [Colletotrichum navitas]